MIADVLWGAIDLKAQEPESNKAGNKSPNDRRSTKKEKPQTLASKRLP